MEKEWVGMDNRPMDAGQEPKSTLAFLLEHAAQDPISFHMPGHKGSWLYRNYGYGTFLQRFMDCDITEIPGADNLFQTEGILQETQRRYARLYEVERSYMLINGTSGGIIAAILASVPEGGQLIMARNCHKSVFNALSLGNIQPVYVYPEMMEKHGILGQVAPSEIERAIREHPQAAAVILPSPNYYGICSDIGAIARIVHEQGKILIVDQAHGAHLKWLSRKGKGKGAPPDSNLGSCLERRNGTTAGSDASGGEGHVGSDPQCAEEAGADIVINSIHKTLASFTQSAVLNLDSQRVDRYALEDRLQAVQSTSPSYLLMASLDVSADLLERHGAELMDGWNENLDWFYGSVGKIPGVDVIEPSGLLDRSKINIDASGLGIAAAELQKKLMERRIFPELATGNILMLMSGIGNRRRDFQRLLEALEEIQRETGACRPQHLGAATETTGERGEGMPKKAELFPIPKRKKRVKLEQAEGMVCASSVIPYPPGIPLVCPGEKLEKEDLEYVRRLRQAGEKVIGVNDAGEVTVGA